jgi:hypothetical protein
MFSANAIDCGMLRILAMREQPITTHVVPIMWVVVKETTTRINQPSNVAVHIPRDPNAFGENTYPEWFDTNNVKHLREQLGDGLAYADEERCFPHQDIAFTEVLRCYHNRTAHYFKMWTKLGIILKVTYAKDHKSYR